MFDNENEVICLYMKWELYVVCQSKNNMCLSIIRNDTHISIKWMIYL